MSSLEKIMDSFANILYENQNLAKEKEQRNLLKKEDYIELLKPATQIIETSKDLSIEEIRQCLYDASGVESTIKDSIYNKQMAPGAVIAYGTNNYQEILSAGIREDGTRKNDFTNGEIIYDLASVTKMFTSISIQILSRNNMVDLNKKIDYYLPDFLGLNNVTVYQLLTFNAPLKTDGRVDCAHDIEEAEKILKTISFNESDDGKRPYTDMGAMVLKYLVEKVSGMNFYEFVQKNILEISNMYNTYVSIPHEKIKMVAPTGKNGFYYKDGNYRINTDVKPGDCYDEKARIMGQREGNLSGHAGLFSTSNDMMKFSLSLLKNELLNFDELCHMADNKTGKKGLPIQYLGKLCYSKNPTQLNSEVYHPLSGRTIASAGWTGTQLTIDPDNKIFYSLLSNRSNNRMTFIDEDKRSLINTNELGKKTIILPNGEKKVDASRYAWDRDDALVHPVIKLSIWYKFLEEVYKDELTKADNVKCIERKI